MYRLESFIHMKKNSKQFFREVKKQTKQAVEDVKEFSDNTKEKLQIYQAFKKISVKMKKVTQQRINLDSPIYGILDENLESLTFRSKDILAVDQLLQTDKHTFKVESISNDTIEYPISVHGVEHKIECKVAMIKKI